MALGCIKRLSRAGLKHVVAALREQKRRDTEKPTVTSGQKHTDGLKAMNLDLARRACGDYLHAGSAVSSRSPTAMPCRPASPTCNSRTANALRHERMRHGPTFSDTFMTSPSRERKTTSIGKRMKNVWIDGAG